MPSNRSENPAAERHADAPPAMATAAAPARVSAQVENFSLVLGGPLYQVYLRSRLLSPAVDLVERRIAAAIVIAWLPLAVLTAADGDLLGGSQVPFLFDLEAHIRFLLALPVLIAAEPVAHRYLGMTVREFVERGVVAIEDQARFDAIIAAGMRLRNSAAIEIALLLCSTVLGYWIWRQDVALHVSTWYVAVDADDRERLSAAGWWYAFVSLNLFRFFLLRWYFRFALWYVLVWRISRLPLRLNPMHPDRAGGLGFMGISLRAFTPVLVAQSLALSGAIGGHIVHAGAPLPQFQIEILGAVVLLVASAVLPLAFFAPALVRVKVHGLREYGSLAMRYVDEFNAKWIGGMRQAGEPLIGSGDIQSLADLGNAHAVIQEMRFLPVGRDAVVGLAFVVALPFAPLVLAVIPLDELISRLIGRLM